MTTSNFLNHDINNGSFGKSVVQETGRRIRELGLFPSHKELTAEHVATLLFALTFFSTGELVRAITARRQDFDEVIGSLANIFENDELLNSLEKVEFYSVGCRAQYSDHSHFAGSATRDHIQRFLSISGDFVRLYKQASTDIRFIDNSF